MEDKVIDISESCSGESYLLKIIGKPVIRYKFYFSDGSFSYIHDEKEANALISEGINAEMIFIFYAIDSYDNEPYVFIAPYELLGILRNIQKAGAIIGTYEGDEILISIRNGVSRYMVFVKDKFYIEEENRKFHDHKREKFLSFACRHDSNNVKEKSKLIIKPPIKIRIPDFSIGGKEYLVCNNDDIEGLLLSFVYEVSKSNNSELSDSASRIIVELRKSRYKINEKLKTIYEKTIALSKS